MSRGGFCKQKFRGRAVVTGDEKPSANWGQDVKLTRALVLSKGSPKKKEEGVSGGICGCLGVSEDVWGYYENIPSV